MAAQNILDIVETPDQGIVMPDGGRLSGHIWRPANTHKVPVPAILEFLPYKKRDETTARDPFTHPNFAKRGYSCLNVDMCSNGDSEGKMEDAFT